MQNATSFGGKPKANQQMRLYWGKKKQLRFDIIKDQDLNSVDY